ncbi:MotA/TolQ/ExbB proton channel family protein [Pseudooceanicola algae]|uniref:Tol-Pal system protein TolQ n=1 Tax=Pseudooceanicola algae TaxID=1537215 RepID=A0A418SGW0_9RHOB|nr:MotA/TolQ/ExbB proton channel family protein [Pseudooceanicola algae]QPM88844.1 Tol-Pal system protein TolQ [Pseudooceanicola algae]
MAGRHSSTAMGFLTFAALTACLAVPAFAQNATAPTDGSGAVTVESAPVIGDSIEQPSAPSASGGTPAAPRTTDDAAPAAPAASDLPAEPSAPASGTDTQAAPGSVAENATSAEIDPETAPADGAAPVAAEDATPPTEAQPSVPEAPQTLTGMVSDASDRGMEFLINGGPAIWAIAALSVVTVALILWKVWRLVLEGAWSRRTSRRAVAAWEQGEAAVAIATVRDRKGVRSRMVHAAMRARLTLEEDAAREETARVAKRLLGAQGSALRALELISTIAPLLGLLGTVMGMISAFQALQAAGSNADPSLLAGGIWEALLTTAAGMAVAIPASAALTWFEAVVERLRQDLEDLAARIFIADLPGEGMGAGDTLSKLAAQ